MVHAFAHRFSLAKDSFSVLEVMNCGTLKSLVEFTENLVDSKIHLIVHCFHTSFSDNCSYLEQHLLSLIKLLQKMSHRSISRRIWSSDTQL